MQGDEPALERLLQLLLHASAERARGLLPRHRRHPDLRQGWRADAGLGRAEPAHLCPHAALPAAGQRRCWSDFSILRHIQGIDGRDRQPWLFLPSPLRAKHTSIKPLLTCWLDCAVAALLSCGEQRDRRCWFIVDEVKSLHRVPSLSDLMAEGRSFGACVVLGFQDLAQLRDVYGADDAKTMSAVLGTKVLFRIADPETARWGADALGEVEEETVKESTRYDAAGDTPKGVQLSAAARAAASGDAGRVAAPGALSLLRPALRRLAGGADHAAASEHAAAPADRHGRSCWPSPRRPSPRASPTCPTRRRRTPGRTIRQPTKQRRREQIHHRCRHEQQRHGQRARHPTLPTLLPSPRRRPRPRRSRARSEPC